MILIRRITKPQAKEFDVDGQALADIIENILINEFNATKQGTVLGDKCFRHFGWHYAKPDLKRSYFVATENGNVIGGCGYDKKDDTTFEVQRLYIKEEFRRKGLGFQLVIKVMDEAFNYYKNAYMETFSSMENSIALFKKLGFELCISNEKPEHASCDVQMILSKARWLQFRESMNNQNLTTGVLSR